MEGPKEIFVPASKYNSCQFCKYFIKEEFYSVDTDRIDVHFSCEHTERKHKGLRTLLWSRNQLQEIEFAVRIQTPDWCPYLDSNNFRKVLVEKNMNSNKNE